MKKDEFLQRNRKVRVKNLEVQEERERERGKRDCNLRSIGITVLEYRDYTVEYSDRE